MTQILNKNLVILLFCATFGKKVNSSTFSKTVVQNIRYTAKTINFNEEQVIYLLHSLHNSVF